MAEIIVKKPEKKGVLDPHTVQKIIGVKNFIALPTTPVTPTLNQHLTRKKYVDDNFAGITHASKHTDGTDDIQDATSGQKGVATAAQITKLDGIATAATKYPDTGEQAFLDADHTKLDGIEATADITDATNVNAAGATMNADTDISATGWVVDEDNMASDLDTKVPTQQSVKAYVDAAAAFDIFDKFREFIPWTTKDFLTEGGDAGYVVSATGPSVRLTAADTTDYDCYCYSTTYWPHIADASKVTEIEFIFGWANSIKEVTHWIRMASATSDPPSETVHHFGWKIIDGNVYASCGDGAQTITDTGVDLVSGLQRTRLRVALNMGTDCKFYVNDVLEVTHDTNLPTVNNYYIHFHVRTTENISKTLGIDRLLIEKEY